MKRGTLSVLVGAHQFLIHPVFVAIAWTRLYGFPTDPRLWIAFVVHDLGYWDKAAMDDAEGERHPELGARIMGRLFGSKWADFTLLHSRFYAKHLGQTISRLCVADKLSVILEPAWLYLPRVMLSGELSEYLTHARAAFVGQGKYAGERTKPVGNPKEWFIGMRDFMHTWVQQNKDTATPEPSYNAVV
jgi:hypothetical protein